jgi:hypothetical protein
MATHLVSHIPTRHRSCADAMVAKPAGRDDLVSVTAGNSRCSRPRMGGDYGRIFYHGANQRAAPAPQSEETPSVRPLSAGRHMVEAGTTSKGPRRKAFYVASRSRSGACIAGRPRLRSPPPFVVLCVGDLHACGGPGGRHSIGIAASAGLHLSARLFRLGNRRRPGKKTAPAGAA